MEEEQTTQCLNFKESIISNLNHLVCIIVIMIAYNGGRSVGGSVFWRMVFEIVGHDLLLFWWLQE
jgi:hypothetical protein